PEAWLSSRAAPVVAAALAPLAGKIARAPVLAYRGDEPEDEASGGPAGEALTRAFDHHDSLACLDFMEAESRGELTRSRREISLLLVDSIADAFGFAPMERRAFYERGYRWAFSMGLLKPGDREALDRKLESLRPSLRELLTPGRAEAERWGDAGAARIAAAWRAGVATAARGALDACAAGRISQTPVNLAWLWSQAHSNRLGIVNVSEAILRYFMHRLLSIEEGAA
ncbi:MAG TPA: lantibiotic dehydratase C-terminal domain-containing protein, partial [Verrucomicrobiae bacterium]|nr:lantibiotic dehydratase C-terminal domain-containing protein [Verrucomicrobiae bacterium]